MDSTLNSAVDAIENTWNRGVHRFDAVRIGDNVPFGEIPASMSGSQLSFSINQVTNAVTVTTAASNAAAVSAALEGLKLELYRQGIIKSTTAY